MQFLAGEALVSNRTSARVLEGSNPSALWQIQRGPRGDAPQTHDRLKKSCESCCRRDSVFRRWRWLCGVRYSPPGKITLIQRPLLQKLQRLWLSYSYPGISDWVGVLEVWIWTYYSPEMCQRMH